MMQTNLHGTVFFFSNDDPPLDGFFQGYCFIGADLIFGLEGAEIFRDETGRRVGPGHDGRYITVEQQDDTYFFSSDYAGYSILYYYHDGTHWAVSSSFANIIDFLREKNIPIYPNYPQLSAIGARGMVLEQLFSLETLAHGVRVVPRTHNLVIEPRRATLQRRDERVTQHDSYGSALGEYLHTWVSRFETMMLSQTAQFTVQLTGGVDSRTNFALIQSARRRLGTDGTPPRLQCGEGGNTKTDLEVATALADHFGHTINGSYTVPPLKLQGSESFMMYRALSLGVYYPFYLPRNRPSVQDITISGGGGGIHRKVYELAVKSPDPDFFFKAFARNLRRPEFEQELVRDAHRFLDTALQPGEDALRVLLRDGRVRYHSGHIPRTRVAFTPLHSVDANRAQVLAGTRRVEEGQFNYDIMNSLEPELVTMPYDSEEKSPGKSVLARLTNATIPADANPGKVWASSPAVSHDEHGEADPMSYYGEAFAQAMDNPFVTNFWGKEMLSSAKALMEKLAAGRSIGNASNGKPLAAILSADLVTPS